MWGAWRGAQSGTHGVGWDTRLQWDETRYAGHAAWGGMCRTGCCTGWNVPLRPHCMGCWEAGGVVGVERLPTTPWAGRAVG